MADASNPQVIDILSDWLNVQLGEFIILEYYDGETVSGHLIAFDNEAVSLISVQKDTRRETPVLANLDRVRIIRRKELTSETRSVRRVA